MRRGLAALAAVILLGCEKPLVVAHAPASLGAPSILVSGEVAMTGDDPQKARAAGLDRQAVDQLSAALGEAGYRVVRKADRPHDLVARLSAAVLVTMGDPYVVRLLLTLEDPATGVQVLSAEENSGYNAFRDACIRLVNRVGASPALSAWAASRKRPPAAAKKAAAARGEEMEAQVISAPAPRPAWMQDGAKVAVLDFRTFTKRVNPDNVSYFTDVVRGSCLGAAPRLEVMTRENLLVLLQSSGKDLANCEGECEVDTGRRIGADLVVSGDVHELGSLLKLALRLHETKTGRLLMATQASGKSIEELDESAQQAAKSLFAPLR